MVGCRHKGAIPICPVGWGFVRFIVVEDVAAQEVGYLLDKASREESEFSVWAGYGSRYGGDACLDVNQLGIEVFMGEGLRTNGGAKEGESSSRCFASRKSKF